MTKTIIALCLGIVTLTGASAAMAAKPQRAKTCEVFSEATTDKGKIGICAPTKAGGKPVYLTRYSIVTITADDGVKTRVMIGYR